MEGDFYTVKAFFRDGGSQVVAHGHIVTAITAFTGTFLRYVGINAPDGLAMLTRCELWATTPEDGTWLLGVLDVTEIKELTPALEKIVGRGLARLLNHAA